MNRWRVGEDMGSKEMDRCPLTEHYNILACKTQPLSQPHLLLVAIYPTNNLLPYLENKQHTRSM
jgi:hypothetical protein